MECGTEQFLVYFEGDNKIHTDGDIIFKFSVSCRHSDVALKHD